MGTAAIALDWEEFDYLWQQASLGDTKLNVIL